MTASDFRVTLLGTGTPVPSPDRFGPCTLVEAGYPKLAAEDWAGILVKIGTPPAVTARLNEAVNKALKTDKVREALVKLGVDPGGGTPEAFGALVRSETKHWTKVVQEAGIKINP